MALATRELELVIIARDHASATLARVGGAFAILGAGVARAGIEGIGFFAEVTNEAIEFRRNVAEAFTQLEIPGGTFEDILHMLRDTARDTAVPLEDLTEVAYDIFSTLTLDRMEQGQELLDAIAQSSVAGQAPARDIGRAVIAWTNALNIASPSAEDFNRILDIQFELVRKGAGTYTEFGGVIGKAIPPFVAANQGVEELAGSLAFLTRNGLSAAEASTSASRAVELLYGAKAIKGLRKIGIEVEDSNGQFRKMDDLLGDVVEHFKGLSDAEKRLQFQEIFGQGRIQARRFFDLILGDGNFEEYLFLLGEMRDASGEVATAFDIMMAEPSVQLDVMKNRFTVLRQEIGDAFIPFLTGKLLPVLDRLLDWWEDLDEIQRNNIVHWAAFATLGITIAGVIATVVGGLILFVGLLSTMTGSFGIALALGGGLIGIIAGLAAAIALAILDWDKFVEIFGPWWEKAVALMEPVIDWIKREWPGAWEIAEEAYQGVVSFFENDWPILWANVQTAVGNAWDEIVRIWEEEVTPAWEGFVGFIQERAEHIKESVRSLVGSEGFQMIPGAVQRMWDDTEPIITQLSGFIRTTLEFIGAYIAFQLALWAFLWEHFGTRIVRFVEITWGTIMGIIEGALLIIQGIMNIFIGLLTLDWEKAWTGIKQIISGAWIFILSLIEGAIGSILNLFNIELPSIEVSWENFWGNLKSTVGRMVPTIMAIIAPLPSLLWRLSPHNRRSPSLVQEVTSGLRAIVNQYENQLGTLKRTANRLTPDISGILSNELASTPNFAFALGGPVGGQPQGGSRIDTNIDRQVNVDKVISQADPREIATAIAWEAMNN